MVGDGSQQRGYTLVELLVVVVMVGVLATLATIGVRKYIFAAKTSEAINMIGSIKAAQEAYKDETFSYLDVSEGNLGAFYPMEKPGRTKHHWVEPSHPHAARWGALGISANSAVQFGYACVAGGAGDAIPDPGTIAPMTWPPAKEPWYVVKAVADQNDDGTQSVYVSSSFTTEIYVENEGE
jgi:type IV pilus assembly protein PilA